MIEAKPFPFDLPIEDSFLHCRNLLRTVPGKRLIISGLWQQKPVLAKIFLKPISGWFEFNRELRGTQALLAAHIATPPIVYAGYLKQSAVFIILFDFLHDAIEFSQCFDVPKPQLERLALLRQLVETIAKQHQTGIIQTDLHLKNFLLAHNSLYSVDTGSIRLQKQPLSIKKSLTFFGLLLAQLATMEEKFKEQAITWYFQLRRWSEEDQQWKVYTFREWVLGFCHPILRRNFNVLQSEKLDVGKTTPALFLNQNIEISGNLGEKIPKTYSWKVYLHQQTAYWQKQREKTLRSKLFRPSTHFAAEKTPRRFWICDRNYLTEEFLALLRAPEYLFSSQQMHIIKDGVTTTVGIIQISDRYFLVKRYNLKSFFHRLKRLITKTRARKSWENAHRLSFRGILTPSPIAMVENRYGMFRGVCYFITEYVVGMTASEYFKPHQVDLVQGRTIAQQILKTLQDLTKENICHGDLKASNIILNEKGVWLIDLDAMRFYQNHSWFSMFKRQKQKDKKRFMRNWQGQSMIGNLFK